MGFDHFKSEVFFYGDFLEKQDKGEMEAFIQKNLDYRLKASIQDVARQISSNPSLSAPNTNIFGVNIRHSIIPYLLLPIMFILIQMNNIFQKDKKMLSKTIENYSTKNKYKELLRLLWFYQSPIYLLLY